MSFKIVQRAEYGLPSTVRSANGSLRPAISQCRYLTCHYTGVSVQYRNRSTPQQILNIQRIFATTKPFEYNWVIGNENDDKVYEYAGNFQAAHSAGNNSVSHGVLMLLGIGEAPTPLMIEKFKWLRDLLIFTGGVRADVATTPHKNMPGARTSCPGDAIMSVWPQILAPRIPEPTAPSVVVVPPSDNNKVGKMNYNFTPVRIFDSRAWGNKFAVGEHTMPVAGANIPPGATAVAVTVTAIDGSGGGFVTLWDGGGMPGISSLNYESGPKAICNSTAVRVSNGQFKIYVSSPVHLLFDVIGYQV